MPKAIVYHLCSKKSSMYSKQVQRARTASEGRCAVRPKHRAEVSTGKGAAHLEHKPARVLDAVEVALVGELLEQLAHRDVDASVRAAQAVPRATLEAALELVLQDAHLLPVLRRALERVGGSVAEERIECLHTTTLLVCEREKQSEREKETEQDRERQSKRGEDRAREGETEQERESESKRETDKDRESDRGRVTEREIDRERASES